MKMDAADSLQQDIGYASFFPLLITAQILLSAWGLGDRKKWIFEVIERLEIKIQENMAPLNYLQR